MGSDFDSEEDEGASGIEGSGLDGSSSGAGISSFLFTKLL